MGHLGSSHGVALTLRAACPPCPSLFPSENTKELCRASQTGLFLPSLTFFSLPSECSAPRASGWVPRPLFSAQGFYRTIRFAFAICLLNAFSLSRCVQSGALQVHASALLNRNAVAIEIPRDRLDAAEPGPI